MLLQKWLILVLALLCLSKVLDINLNYMTGASNKPFDYMACGLALLVCDLSDWKQMYVESWIWFSL